MATTNFAKLIVDTAPATLEALAKAQIRGEETGLRKSNYLDAIQKFADLTYPTSLSPQQRFAKAIGIKMDPARCSMRP
jgi:hypothetical protein